MSLIVTAGTWVRLPTALGAADRARKDQPGDAAWFQLLASNLTHAARAAERRVQGERGPAEVWADCTTTNDERTFLWSGIEADGVLAQYIGTWRVRLYGEQQRPPRIVLSARGASTAGQTLGLLILAMPTFDAPDPTVTTQAIARTTSASVVSLTATINLTPAALGLRTFAPPPTGSPPATAEAGNTTAVSLFVGAYCTSGSSGAKAQIGGVTVYLAEPS